MLPMITARVALMARPLVERRAVLDQPARLAAAGMTWESLAGWLQGPLDAAVFGAGLAVRAEHADLVQFGTGSDPVRFRTGESVLRVLDRFGNLGGTNTADAVRGHYRGHDRVVIVSDERAWSGWQGEDPTRAVPPRVPVYTWNLAGYRFGHGPSGGALRHTFGGLTDAGFAMIPLLENGQSGSWPF